MLSACRSEKNATKEPEAVVSLNEKAKAPNSVPVATDSQTAPSPTKKPQEEKPARNSLVGGWKPGDPSPGGRWNKIKDKETADGINPWQKEQFEKAEALGYLQGYQKAESEGGITRFNKKKAGDGINFYTSGHAPVAVLMDMDGKVLHKWEFPFEKAWPDNSVPRDPIFSLFWRRAYLYPNGDVLAIFDNAGMIKIDKDSKLLWTSALGQHHEIKVTENGDIYTLTRTRSIHPDINPKEPIVADFVTVLSPDGKVKKNVSLIKAMEKNPSAMRHWDKSKLNKGDIFHTNSVQILDGRAASLLPEFKAGRVLVSMYCLNAVFVVDMDEEKIVWDFASDFIGQHDAQILPNRNLLLLDNHGWNTAPRGKSRVLEFKLPDMKTVWTYDGTPEEEFGTPSCGTVQRLANGNTVIAETDNGRALEVTDKGEIVWEFISPHRAGPDNELVASLFQIQRLPKSYANWLKDR